MFLLLVVLRVVVLKQPATVSSCQAEKTDRFASRTACTQKRRVYTKETHVYAKETCIYNKGVYVCIHQRDLSMSAVSKTDSPSLKSSLLRVAAKRTGLSDEWRLCDDTTTPNSSLLRVLITRAAFACCFCDDASASSHESPLARPFVKVLGDHIITSS